ncbi:MAG: hypothetical protein JKY88_14745 [Pseudomonadales bacterium]|nr:hypothetical protein [Pseudomonadales bacterium]
MDTVNNQLDQSNPISPRNPDANSVHWKQHVKAWQTSGLSQRAYAHKHDLTLSSFYYWQRKLKPSRRISTPRFAPVKVSQSPSLNPIRIVHPSGFVIECPVGTDVAWLQSLMGLNHAS